MSRNSANTLSNTPQTEEMPGKAEQEEV
jgi:hypothetical protein